MTCTACKATAHKLTRVAAGQWLCGACRFECKPGVLVIKALDIKPPAPETVRVLAFILKLAAPDYSRN